MNQAAPYCASCCHRAIIVSCPEEGFVDRETTKSPWKSCVDGGQASTLLAGGKQLALCRYTMYDDARQTFRIQCTYCNYKTSEPCTSRAPNSPYCTIVEVTRTRSSSRPLTVLVKPGQ